MKDELAERVRVGVGETQGTLAHLKRNILVNGKHVNR